MPTTPPPIVGKDGRVGAATIAAGFLVAQQVLGKALRDTLFLTQFGIGHLPRGMLLSALVSGVVVVMFSRLALLGSPRRLAALGLLFSAALFVLAWSFFSTHPAASTWLTYLHTGSLTAATVSAFWALVTHSLDPYLARREVPRILTGGTLGGVVGGLVTWRAASLSSARDLLLLGALLSLVSLGFVWRIRLKPKVLSKAQARISWAEFKRDVPYLRYIALLVVLSASTQAILDYLLSSAAAAELERGPRLLSFFALFQTSVGILTFLVQLSVSPGVLERFGVGRVLLVSPLVLAGSLLSPFFLAPLSAAVLMRGAEGVLGGSVQRSAYEILFAPLDDSKRRVSKPVLDVALDRFGTLIGGALVTSAVALSGVFTSGVLLGLALALALLRALLAPALQAGYRRLLADNLRSGRLALSSASLPDKATLGSLSVEAPAFERESLRNEIERVRARRQALSPLDKAMGVSVAAFDLPAGPALGGSVPPGEDEVVAGLAELRSGREESVRAVLLRRRSQPFWVPQVIQLLGDDGLARDAADWLSTQNPAPVGALEDALLSDALPAAARRRVARLIGKIADERAAESLLAALETVPTSVRPGVAQALARLGKRRPIPREPLLRAVIEAASSPLTGNERAQLEEIFALLAAAYPAEPVQAALRALEHEGELRGTALEWLDTVLPYEVKTALWSKIMHGGERATAAPRSLEELRHALGSRALAVPDSDADG